MIDNASNVFFDPLSVLFGNQWQAMQGCKYKMSVEIVIFNFHDNDFNKVEYKGYLFSTKVGFLK